ncbi:MAG: hypothetical protein L0Y72_30005 [Gemmataceae bacterium]|nr:hypothetical protein [Gemmataceae bacterium]MCI0743282.1 hypothetical protein [Gemmataceae bacterium]
MRRMFFAAAVLAVAGWAVLSQALPGRAQVGPDEKGSTFKDPLSAPLPANPAGQPMGGGTYIESVLKKSPMGAGQLHSPLAPSATGIGAGQMPQQLLEKPDINQDIHVTKEQGPWMVFVQSYSGPEASILARQMVGELRGTYKLPAYTFNFGAEERRKEYERIKATIDQQKEFLRQNNLALDQPIRVRHMRIEEQVGVLVGGYSSDEAAKNALAGLRKLKPPDPNKVHLSKMFYTHEDAKKSDQPKKGEIIYVNPFKAAFVARNPTIKQERPAEWDNMDIGYLRKINAGEPLSLLNCKKPITLAIKQIQTPTNMQGRESKGGFLKIIGITKAGEQVDVAAQSAHNLAELLRKSKLEAYVLHTKFSSIVTVGGFDSPDDPNLRAMQETIEARVWPTIAPMLFQGQPIPRPLPMKVPQ